MMYLFLFSCWITISFGLPIHVIRNRSLRREVVNHETSGSRPIKKRKFKGIKPTDPQDTHDDTTPFHYSTELDSSPFHPAALNSNLEASSHAIALARTELDSASSRTTLDGVSSHSTSSAGTFLDSAQEKNLPETCNYVGPTKGKCGFKVTFSGKSKDRCSRHQRCSDCDKIVNKKGKCLTCLKRNATVVQYTHGHDHETLLANTAHTHNDQEKNLPKTCNYVSPRLASKEKCGLTVHGKSNDRCSRHQRCPDCNNNIVYKKGKCDQCNKKSNP